MHKTTLNRINTAVLLLMATLLLGSCFVMDKSLFNGIITAKHLWVQLFSIVIIAILAVRVFFATRITIHSIDILVVVLVMWMSLRELLSEMPHANSQQYLINIATYFVLYMFFRIMGNRPSLLLPVIVIYLLIVLAQSIIGLMQLYGFMYSHHNMFKITGYFHNPGPFSGFVVSALPMALGLCLGTRSLKLRVGRKENGKVDIHQNSVLSKWLGLNLQQNRVLSSEFWVSLNWDKVLNYFAQFVLVILLLVLPAARSRAAWLGVILSCLYVTWHFNMPQQLIGKLHSVFKDRYSKVLKKFLLSIGILLVLASIFGLYKLKQGSADGRMLMWQVSWEMIKDKPILGYGQGGFEANYANYQAEWFRSEKGTPGQALVAGIPDAPFNELIRIFINYGFIGLLLIVALLLRLYHKRAHRSTKSHEEELSGSLRKYFAHSALVLKGGLLSIIVFSLFSYPLDIAPILVQITILVALITNLSHNIYILNPSKSVYIPKFNTLFPQIAVSIILLATIPFVAKNMTNKYYGLKHWQEAHLLYKYEIYDDGSDEYVKADEYLPNNGLLQQMHGKCLAMDEKMEEAKDILEEAMVLRADPILYTTLGDTYKVLKEYQLAESSYRHAWQMVPHKFYPGYLLAKLYDESEQKQKAAKIAHELLNKHIKVDSKAIEEIKGELLQILQNREFLNNQIAN